MAAHHVCLCSKNKTTNNEYTSIPNEYVSNKYSIGLLNGNVHEECTNIPVFHKVIHCFKLTSTIIFIDRNQSCYDILTYHNGVIV